MKMVPAKDTREIFDDKVPFFSRGGLGTASFKNLMTCA